MILLTTCTGFPFFANATIFDAFISFLSAPAQEQHAETNSINTANHLDIFINKVLFQILRQMYEKKQLKKFLSKFTKKIPKNENHQSMILIFLQRILKSSSHRSINLKNMKISYLSTALFAVIIFLSGGCSSSSAKQTTQNDPVDPVDPCSQNVPLTGGVELKKIRNQGKGPLEGTPYHYEIWVDEGGAEGVKLSWYGADQGGGAAFKTEWTKPDCYLGRIGYFWGMGEEYPAYKNIYVDFNYTRSGRGTAGNWSYIGIYGWSRNRNAEDPNERLIEYYIVEDWFGSQTLPDTVPLDVRTTQGTIIGTVEADGAIYDIHKSLRIQKPSIEGTKTFTQIFSIRRDLRQCGTISVTEHFKNWEELGLKLGNLYEAKFLIEAGSGIGWIDLSYLSFSQEEEPRTE